MSNPITKWELQDFSVEFDVGKLMENFFNLRSFSTYGVIHTHHIQSFTFDVSTQVGGNTTEYGPFTFDEPFATGVVPIVLCTLGSVNATRPAAMAGGIITAFDIDNTVTKIAVFNSTGTQFGSGIIGQVTAIDPTYNTSLA